MIFRKKLTYYKLVSRPKSYRRRSYRFRELFRLIVETGYTCAAYQPIALSVGSFFAGIWII